jgi:hypothetical protein
MNKHLTQYKLDNLYKLFLIDFLIGINHNKVCGSHLQAEQEEIMRSIPPTQKGLAVKDFRKMKYLSQVN